MAGQIQGMSMHGQSITSSIKKRELFAPAVAACTQKHTSLRSQANEAKHDSNELNVGRINYSQTEHVVHYSNVNL